MLTAVPLEPLWVFADQLGPHVHGGAHADRPVVLIESRRALCARRYHRQKLHLVLSGMRHLSAELGDRVRYLAADTYREALAQVGSPVVVHEPTSRAAQRFVERLQADGMVAEILPTPTFALSKQDFAAWAGDRTRFRMADFYEAQRKRFDLLMEPDGAPVGGRWSYDDQNRQPPPKGAATLDVDAPWQPEEDDVDGAVRRDLDEWGLDTIGVDGPRWFAVTHEEALAARRHFIERRLDAFGPYEDAILTEDWAMAHSLLSVPLNLGLLEPIETAQAAEAAYADGAVSLATAEGFVRQVSAGGSTSGTCTGTSVRTTGARTPCAPGGHCRGGSPSSTPNASRPCACAPLSKGCAIAAGCTTSSG